MNPWRRGPITVNPYVRTAFRVAGVPSEVTLHRLLVYRLGEMRNLVRADPTAHAVLGEPVTEEAINAAEEVLLDPRQRIVEELFHHATEELPRAAIAELLKRCEAAIAANEDQDLENGMRTALRLVVQRLRDVFASQLEGPDPGFGALETLLEPPFGPLRNS